METQSWLTSLQENGYRLTEARRAVVETIAHAQSALNPLEVYDQTRPNHPGLGLVTVYRTIEKLEELGLIQRVHQPGGCNAYLPSAHGHQHLLICQTCGQAQYVEGDDLDAFLGRIGSQNGYTITEHWLQLFGQCPACQAK